MNIIHCSQGDALWHAQRTGKITASRLIDILPKKTCKVPASRLNYMWEKVTERITFDVADHYVSPWMERGTELEPDARTAYGMEYGVLVRGSPHNGLCWRES
jgi:hypothetical protein